MNLVMFDIDGTLLKSYDFDTLCYKKAVESVTGLKISPEWSNYTHVTDKGILQEFMESSNYSGELREIESKVKAEFCKNLEEYLNSSGVETIEGAREFMEYLKKREDITLCIATGGWYESAILKLDSASLNVEGIPIASSSDHISRIEIMKIAESRVGQREFLSRTYFGDGIWDKSAANELGYNFIAIGEATGHNKWAKDYLNPSLLLDYMR